MEISQQWIDKTLEYEDLWEWLADNIEEKRWKNYKASKIRVLGETLFAVYEAYESGNMSYISDFMRAAIKNDFQQAIFKASELELTEIQTVAYFIYNFIPSDILENLKEKL